MSKIVAFQGANLQDVEVFIANHQQVRRDLMVQVDPTGLGDAFADRLEAAGYTVKRLRNKPFAAELVEDLNKSN